jgi:hypothetical protein
MLDRSGENFSWTVGPLKIAYTETSLINYQFTLLTSQNIDEGKKINSRDFDSEVVMVCILV